MSILAITGASGYLGRALLKKVLLESRFQKVLGIDVRPLSSEEIQVHQMDIRDRGLSELFRREKVTHVVHLAFVVNPTHNPQFEYDVDVNGTGNILRACLEAGVKNLVVSSSIAAYGWHADSPIPIPESHALRGNEDFPYSKNKVLVEQLVEDFTRANPQCRVTVLRICNVLGPNVHNAISAGIEAPILFGVRGRDPYLAFTHEEDMTEILYQAVVRDVRGVFNVAGKGMVQLSQIATIARRGFVRLPAPLLRFLLSTLFRLRILPFGGGQMGFVRYSCVPDISKLEREFGYVPRHTSEETFREFVRLRLKQ